MENRTMTTVENPTRTQYPVCCKTVRVNDLDIFCREAGPERLPVILLLYGFPASSNTFPNLIPRSAGSFRLVAPGYPGYGPSRMPDHSVFECTFENYAKVINAFVQAIGLGWPCLQHRGGPAGFPKVIDSCTVASAGFRGNRQYLTTGTWMTDNRAALIMAVTPGGVEIQGAGILRNQFMAWMGAPAEAAAAVVPHRRLGKPEDISERAAFPLTPRAGWITGQNYFGNGGLAF
ncbi:alpha/beta fold hydrolase [Paludibaculum fermentans]|uniref:AB hydrolase-1 domain-containing protein n=1 Tax=Paludibaculum fermentans TaxID=1473598 RepID=A0A7S7NV66_PALFE|nr:alpha/beta fold hydrolase [Paludibaculum fermentans]QOY90326.1 hypothetical protein IRI77_10330 [Paludibaculum fermentans]